MADIARGPPRAKGSQRRERVELFARYFAKFLQRIDAGPAHDQLIELADSLVGCKIGRNGFMHDFVGAFDGLGRRDDTHSADHGVKRDEVFYLRFVA